ncbi:MAG: hypothetical protein Q9160_005555 [Pyrenula sp. 1 TL-2023]
MDVNPSNYNPPADDKPPYSTNSAEVTSTVGSRPVITTIEVPYSIQTQAADDGNVKAGDLIVDLSPSFRTTLLNAAKKACNLPGKRDIGPVEARAAACDMDGYLMSTIGDGAPGGLDIISFRKPIIRAHDVEAAIRKIFEAKRLLYKSRMWIGGIAVLFMGMFVQNLKQNMDGPIHIPKEDLGEPQGPTQADSPDPKQSSSSSASGCKTTKTGTASPIKNDNLHCPCAIVYTPIQHIEGIEILTAAQSVLQTVLNSPTPTPPPACHHQADPRGAMSKSPTEWCECGPKTYSTVQGGDGCPDTITNNPTITLADAKPTDKPDKPEPPKPPVCYQDNGAGWNFAVADITKAIQTYCDKKAPKDKVGPVPGSSFTGSCALFTDVKTKDKVPLAATFNVQSKCPDTPHLTNSGCVNALNKIINSCPTAPNTKDGKWGGTYTENCIGYQWAVMAISQTGLNPDTNKGGNC